MYFRYYTLNIDTFVPISKLVCRTGTSLKNNEWLSSKIIDLSTMNPAKIFINDFSSGSNFTTNIRTVNQLDLLYGSIRPYFKKVGFALDVNYVAGTVFSFKPNDNLNYCWILATISSERFHDFTTLNSQGTKMPIINWDTLCTYQVPYDSNLIKKFNEKIKPMFLHTISKAREIRKLKQIKHILLSKYF